MEDIPEALREKSNPKQAKFPPYLWLAGGILGGIIILGLGSLSLSLSTSEKKEAKTEPSAIAPPSPQPTTSPIPVENILGHLPYKEAPASQLKPITADGSIRLRIGAAEKFQQMQKAARAEGIILTPISGFRTVEEQKYLFFEVKAQRNQPTTKRAEVSAPPNYSEHHTGYAVDIGDGKAPSTNLQESFEKTPAFRWLEQNANRYSFELSFPRNNPQGINYEPWHWRFVGNQDSLETFYKARELQKTSEPKEPKNPEKP